MRRALVATLIGLGSVASPSVAQAPTWTAAAQPNQAGKQSRIAATANGTATSTGQSVPQGVTLRLFKAFVVDLKAVAGRCTSSASPPSCPADSQAATGQFSGNASEFGINQSFSGTIRAFLAPPSSGDLADVIVVANVTGYGSASARGQLVAVSDPTFGYELRLDPLPTAMVPPGATATLKQLTLTVGAVRSLASGSPRHRGPARRHKACRAKGRRCKPKPCPAKSRRCKPKARKPRRRPTSRHARARTVSLITNPSTCTASWPLQLSVRYADHTEVRDAPIACTP